MKNIAIIGAGVFGVVTALRLSQEHNVTLFEKHDTILHEASTNNHWRHHIGYHYPRSKETVAEIRNATLSFEKKYGGILVKGFPSYYAVGDITQTTPERFIAFCKEENLPYEVCTPPEGMFDENKIGVCIKTPEAVYDMDAFTTKLKEELAQSPVKLHLNSEIVRGSHTGDQKTLTIKKQESTEEQTFDIIINATYFHFNTFHKWFGFPKKEVQYELMELLEIELPKKDLFGVTIMDGAYPSVLPRGKRGTFTLGHVRSSVLKDLVAQDADDSILTQKNIPSNKDQIMKESIEYLPFLKDAKVLRSLFVTRVVKAHHEDDDARPTEITQYGNGFYSIFAGKIITCVDTAENIAKMIQGETP